MQTELKPLEPRPVVDQHGRPAVSRGGRVSVNVPAEDEHGSGFYWSSTSNRSTSAYNYCRGFGHSVRCILNEKRSRNE